MIESEVQVHIKYLFMNSTCVNIPQTGFEPIPAPSVMLFYPLNYWGCLKLTFNLLSSTYSIFNPDSFGFSKLEKKM